MKFNRTIFSAFLSVALAKTVVLLAMMIITPIIVRLLGATQYGMYATLMAVFGLVMILVSSGITSGAQKFLSEERADQHWRDHVFGYYFRIAVILSLTASVLLLLLSEFGIIRWAFGPEYSRYFYLLAILAVAAQIREYVKRSFMGLKLESISEPLRVLHNVGFGIAAVTLAYLGYGVAGILMGHIIASLSVAIIGLLILTRHLSLSYVLKSAPSEFPRKELRNFNDLSIVYFFLLTSLYHVDVLMLDFFTTSDQVGYYKAALVIVHFLWFVPKAVQMVLIQSTSDLWTQNAIEEINHISTKATRYTLLLSIILGIGLAVLANDFIPLYYGADFTPAVLPLLLLIPGTLGFAMARPLLAITHAKGAMRVLIIATGAAAIGNFLLNLLLIPTYGIAGAAVATSIGYFALPVFHVIGARHIGYRPIADLRLQRIAVTTILTSIGIVGLAMLFESAIISLIVVPPIGFTLFATIAILTGTVDVNEILSILRQLPAPVDRAVIRIESHLKQWT